MIRDFRNQYNRQFRYGTYQDYIRALENIFPGQLDFRVAESPVFVPKEFERKMISACDHILQIIQTDNYKKESERAIPAHLKVPNEDAFPHFIAFDFGVCMDENGSYEPQLIEMQGFPSLFAWQVLLPETHRTHFYWPQEHDVYLNGFDRSSYLELFRRIVVGDEDPQHVILLEILPHQQKTRVDFYATEQLLGIKTVCLTKLVKEGRQLFYYEQDKKILIKRIYNRVIFDDLSQQSADVQEKGKIFMEDLDVKWLPHPNWFFRLSKFTLPFIDHPFVPSTSFLDPSALPEDLHNYVVKPLFSFAGQGVIIDVSREEIEKIRDPENWILQRKVQYAEAIPTPNEPAKVEIRLFYFCEEGKKPVAVNNLARLSKGKMIGVRYNKEKDWVGGSFCLFQQEKTIR